MKIDKIISILNKIITHMNTTKKYDEEVRIKICKICEYFVKLKWSKK